jgi:hypothetical protein
MRQNERLNSFKKIILGQYVLKQFENKERTGNFYIENLSKWKDIKNKNIYFNIKDKNNGNPFKQLREVIVENFLKTNFIIIRLESPSSSLSFYCNNLPNTFDLQFSMIKLLVNPFDFIDSEGEPIYNETYTLSYILNDPNKEINIVKTQTTNVPSSTSHTFSLDTPMTLPKGNLEPKRIYSNNPNIPPGVADFNIYLSSIIKSKSESESQLPKIKINIPMLTQDTIVLIVFILLLIGLIGSKYL